jgi:hypothetical protein
MKDETPAAQDGQQRTLFIVSDATGETAFRVARSALKQFKDIPIRIEWKQGTRTVAQVVEVVEAAASSSGLIVHTLVVPDLREVLVASCRAHNVPCIDVIGAVVMQLSDWLDSEPIEQPGMIRQLDEDYFKRIEAMEFAVEHDDGRKPDDLDRADLVLVGVSRTSKTPLSMYFARRGWLVGNIPLIAGIDPPAILYRLPPGKVVGLTVRPERLSRIRGNREKLMGVSGDYGDPRKIAEELQWAREIMAQGNWPVVDMSARSIEEAAMEILGLVRRKG